MTPAAKAPPARSPPTPCPDPAAPCLPAGGRAGTTHRKDAGMLKRRSNYNNTYERLGDTPADRLKPARESRCPALRPPYPARYNTCRPHPDICTEGHPPGRRAPCRRGPTGGRPPYGTRPCPAHDAWLCGASHAAPLRTAPTGILRPLQGRAAGRPGWPSARTAMRHGAAIRMGGPYHTRAVRFCEKAGTSKFIYINNMHVSFIQLLSFTLNNTKIHIYI